MLSDIQIASMRKTVGTSQPSLATILRKVVVDDGMGGQVDNYTALYRNVPCRVEELPVQTESAEGGQITATQAFAVSLPWNQDIAAPDKIVVNGITLEVKDRTDGTSWQVQIVAFCVRVGG